MRSKNGRSGKMSWTMCMLGLFAVGMVGANPVLGRLIGISWEGGVYHIDEMTGAYEEICMNSFSPPGFNSMAQSPTGHLYTVNSRTDKLYEIDPATGMLHLVLDFNTDITVQCMAFAPDSTLYFYNNGGGDGRLGIPGTLYRMNINTGILYAIGSPGEIYTGLHALDFAPDGTLYSWDSGKGDGFGPGLVTIDPLTAMVTDVNLIQRERGILSLVFGPDGTLYGYRDQLYSINIENGALTTIGPENPYDIRGLAYVPEPATLILLGLGGIGLIRRRILHR